MQASGDSSEPQPVHATSQQRPEERPERQRRDQKARYAPHPRVPVQRRYQRTAMPSARPRVTIRAGVERYKPPLAGSPRLRSGEGSVRDRSPGAWAGQRQGQAPPSRPPRPPVDLLRPSPWAPICICRGVRAVRLVTAAGVQSDEKAKSLEAVLEQRRRLKKVLRTRRLEPACRGSGAQPPPVRLPAAAADGAARARPPELAPGDARRGEATLPPGGGALQSSGPRERPGSAHARRSARTCSAALRAARPSLTERAQGTGGRGQRGQRGWRARWVALRPRR
jgi:hypothetical protein